MSDKKDGHTYLKKIIDASNRVSRDTDVSSKMVDSGSSHGRVPPIDLKPRVGGTSAQPPQQPIKPERGAPDDKS